MEGENEQQRDRHLYFIGLDTAMAVKLMSQRRLKRAKKGRRKLKWEGGGRKEMSEKAREGGEEGGSMRG